MKIWLNVEGETPEDVKRAILELVGGSVVSGTATVVKASDVAVEAVTKTAAESAKKTVNKKVEKPDETELAITKTNSVPVEESAEPTVTYDAMHKALTALASKGKAKTVVELLGKYGAKKLADVKPADFPAMLAEVEAIQ